MDWAEEVTAGNDRMTLFVAFNYGGRAEILDAAARFGGGTEEDFAKLLYAPEMTDPDLLIRTSGERRLSNYLLWQCAYSELVFSDALWPDFGDGRPVGGARRVRRARAPVRSPVGDARRHDAPGCCARSPRSSSRRRSWPTAAWCSRSG